MKAPLLRPFMGMIHHWPLMRNVSPWDHYVMNECMFFDGLDIFDMHIKYSQWQLIGFLLLPWTFFHLFGIKIRRSHNNLVPVGQYTPIPWRWCHDFKSSVICFHATIVKSFQWNLSSHLWSRIDLSDDGRVIILENSLFLLHFETWRCFKKICVDNNHVFFLIQWGLVLKQSPMYIANITSRHKCVLMQTIHNTCAILFPKYK